MPAILWVLGLVTAAAGFIAIGFGIPINAFSLGNTLLMAGTTAVVGGFILIGLAAVVRQLKRIADANPVSSFGSAVDMRPVSENQDPRTTFLNTQVAQGLVHAPSTPRPRPGRPPEPKLAEVPPSGAEPDSVEWLRPKDKEPTLGERAVIEEFEASLAPQPAPPIQSPPPAAPPQVPPLPPLGAVTTPRSSPASAPKMPDIRNWSPAQGGEPPAQPNPPRPEPVAVRSAPERAPAGMFDSVWPDAKPGRSAETIERARKPEVSSPQREESKTSADTLQAVGEEESRPVAILKSGMIDGMAYTLFADGSIEAVLPTGTLRFASVDALRLHLEKNT
jgi:hypothetical protein